MLVAKMDLLLKHLHERAEFKEHRNNYAQAMDSYMTCEVCGNGGHSGNDCPRPVKMRPTSTATTTGSVHKEAKGGVKHTHHSKEEVIISTQISIPILIQTNPQEALSLAKLKSMNL